MSWRATEISAESLRFANADGFLMLEEMDEMVDLSTIARADKPPKADKPSKGTDKAAVADKTTPAKAAKRAVAEDSAPAPAAGQGRRRRGPRRT